MSTRTASMSAPAIALVNGRDCAGRRIGLRLAGERILEVGSDVDVGMHDRVLDLQGARLLPGLINAHDHLQLNHFPSLAYRSDYANVSEWIAELQARRRVDRALQAAQALDLRERLFLGGIKNLLSGVTSVAHHDPLYDPLLRDDFPVGLIGRYGWSHSLSLDGPERVRGAHALTQDDAPWIVHAAEGLDAAAAAEFAQLDALGCITPKTVIVHGVAMTGTEHLELISRGGALVWCPASNLRLFGRTARVTELLGHGRIALGTDSRLSGSHDLLAELHIAHETAALEDSALERLVTANAARVLRLHDRGALRPGYVADITVLARDARLSNTSREAVRLVMMRGVPMYGERTYLQALSPNEWAAVEVDAVPKALRRALADTLLEMSVREARLELSNTGWKVA